MISPKNLRKLKILALSRIRDRNGRLLPVGEKTIDPNQYSKEYYQKNKEKIRLKRKPTSFYYYLTNKENIKGKQKIWIYKKKYKITVKKVLVMVDEQNNKCAVCRESFDNINNKPFVDHDHKTKKVRGLLCRHCNSLLGFAKDNETVLEAAIQYLVLSKTKRSSK